MPELRVAEQALERSPVIGHVVAAGPQRPCVDGVEADPPEAFGDLAAAAAGRPDVQVMVGLGFGVLGVFLAEQA